MKKIYTVTLDAEDYLSGNFKDNLRILTVMVYEYVYNFIGDEIIPLNINKNIVRNNIHYTCRFGQMEYGQTSYWLDSDFYDDGYINYEPFIIGNRTFAMTIVDDTYDVEFLEKVVQYHMNLLKLRYKFKIEVFPYESKNINDESYRDDMINQIHKKYFNGSIKRNKVVRILKNNFCRNRNKVGLCGR